jgi:hypothetical protein
MELNVLDGSMDDILFRRLKRKEAADADEWIGIAQATICLIIYCPLAKNIVQRYRLLGVQFP